MRIAGDTKVAWRKARYTRADLFAPVDSGAGGDVGHVGGMPPPSCLRGAPTLALSGRATGLMLALFGTVIDSCEALVVRRMGVYLEDWHEDGRGWSGDSLEALTPRMVIFYKYLFTASFTLIGLLIVIGARLSELIRGFKAGPRHILAAASCQSFISMLLTLSLLKTETATVYLLYLLAPLWAALFGRFFLREPIRRQATTAGERGPRLCLIGLGFLGQCDPQGPWPLQLARSHPQRLHCFPLNHSRRPAGAGGGGGCSTRMQQPDSS